VEIISRRRHAIVAGRHPGGATLVCVRASFIPRMSWGEIVSVVRAWVGPTAPLPPPLSVSDAALPLPGGDQVKAALIWWMQQPQNIAAVDALVARRAKGQYVAVRNERTPSVRLRGLHAGRRTWRDFGANETLDDYEIFCRLSGIDKRTHKWQVVNAWREARGLQPLQLGAGPAQGR
jgi:hypothetical protein